MTSLVRTGFSPASLPETPNAASGVQGFSASDWIAQTGTAISHIPSPYAIVPANDYVRERGRKVYELKNHLGNVLSVVSDLKIGKDGQAVGVIGHGYADFYLADLVSAQDYYAFGGLMPGRTYATPEYRYGFNGKEKDAENQGDGNIYDYGFRIYDPRVAKFLSVDPLTAEYPWYTPYQFAGNKPIN